LYQSDTKLTHTAQDYTPAPHNLSHNTQCWTPYGVA